jgi:ribosomal protein S27AE
MQVFIKALKVVSEELQEELMWEHTKAFLESLWIEVKNELGKAGDVVWNLKRFIERVEQEVESRKIDLRKFRNQKNEPITNMFKRIIKEVAKESNIQLSNDSLSKLLNYIRSQYSTAGILSAGLYPAEAFLKREYYSIPDDLGDTGSCFRAGGCNEGSALWLIKENKVYERAWFVVFHYKSGSREGYGRCWAYTMPNAVYATNFYSYRFEIKDEGFRYPIIRLIRKLFNLSENVKFATGRSAPLPIYLNGDSIIIYEPSHYESSYKVLDTMEHLMSRCLWCQDEVEIRNLTKHDNPIYYSPVGDRVNGLIVCSQCLYEIEDTVECEDCGSTVHRDDTRYIDGYGYVCDDCFEYGWFFCDECDEPHRRDYGVVTSDGRMLCDYCARRIGAFCDECGDFILFDDDIKTIETYSILEGRWTITVQLCSQCADTHLRKYQCIKCGSTQMYLDRDYIRNATVRNMVRLDLCPECYSRRNREIFEFAFENTIQPTLFSFRNVIDEKLAMPD